MVTYDRRKVLPSTKMHPFRILVMVLYSNADWVTNDEYGRVTVQTSPLARVIRVTNTKLRDYFIWLEEVGYLKNLVLSYGTIQFSIQPPRKGRLWENEQL